VSVGAGCASAGHRLPTTELELFGRHVSTVSGGRCERCELATMAGQPDGCVRPMPFEGNEEDGTCTAAPRWRPDARLMIRTAAGHKTPAIVQLKGVEVHNLTVDARAGGWISLVGATLGAGGADIQLSAFHEAPFVVRGHRMALGWVERGRAG
jgi:hypothetical protein